MPTGLRGNDATKSTDFGAFTEPSFSLQSAISSSAVAACPALSSTTAFTASPHFSSGTPITAQSCTAGWLQITCSTSLGYTLKPPEMIMSFLRSVMCRQPSASMWPMSPVCSQPSTMVSAVLSGAL